MKKIKFFAAAIAICGASLLGYNAYSNATMTPEERLFQQNLEALTSDESGGMPDTLQGYEYKPNSAGGKDCCIKSYALSICDYATIGCASTEIY